MCDREDCGYNFYTHLYARGDDKDFMFHELRHISIHTSTREVTLYGHPDHVLCISIRTSTREVTAILYIKYGFILRQPGNQNILAAVFHFVFTFVYICMSWSQDII